MSHSFAKMFTAISAQLSINNYPSHSGKDTISLVRSYYIIVFLCVRPYYIIVFLCEVADNNDLHGL